MKKILSIVLVLMMVLSLMPSGALMLAANAAITVGDTQDAFVTKVDIAAGETWYIGQFRDSAGTQGEYIYTLSFEYYLPDEYLLEFDSAPGYYSVINGTTKLRGGHNTMSATIKVKKYDRNSGSGAISNAFIPLYKNLSADATLYVWNMLVTLNGEEIVLDSSVDGIYENAALDSSKTLREYDWYATMNDYAPDLSESFVRKIEFGAYDNWYIGEFRDSYGTRDEYVYTLSFEYYMPDEYDLHFSNGPGCMTILEGSAELKGGHHTMSVKVEVEKYSVTTGSYGWVYERGVPDNAFVPLYHNGPEEAILYVWNMRVTLNGEEVELYPLGDNTISDDATVTAFERLCDYDWYDTMDTYQPSPVVQKVDISSGQSWYIGQFRDYAGIQDEYIYTLSFEYYMPDEYLLEFDSAPGYYSVINGTTKLRGGHNTMSATIRVKKYDRETGSGPRQNAFIPLYKNLSADATLYVWNMRATLNGEEIVLRSPDGIYIYDKATVDARRRLKNYSWSSSMDEYQPDLSNPFVKQVQINTNEKWYIGEFRDSYGTREEYVYNVSFEYYMPDEYVLEFGSAPGWYTVVDGSAQLRGGHHTMNATIKVTKHNGETGSGAQENAFIPLYKNLSANATLYVWNMRVTLNGEEIELYRLGNNEITDDATVTANYHLKNYSWYSSMDEYQPDLTNPFVTKVDLGRDKNWYIGQYSNRSEASTEHVYTLSFEYYMPEDYSLSFSNAAGWTTVTEGSTALRIGHHRVCATLAVQPYDDETGFGAAGNAFIPLYHNNSSHATLYIWNMQVKLNGEEIRLATVEDNGGATVDPNNKLKDFSWYDTMDELIVTSIAVNTPPSKTVYAFGEALDADGLSLTVTYNDGSTEVVTEGYTVSGYAPFTAGTSAIVVTYANRTTSFYVTVKEPVVLTAISIATLPNKTVYMLGETLNVNGFSLLLSYSDGSTETLTRGFSINGFDSSSVGEKFVTVSYEGKTTVFSVTVREPAVLVSIAVDSLPNKIEYAPGETLDTTGLSLTLSYNDGTTETITHGYTVSQVALTTAGKKTVTVSYEGQMTTFAVTVKRPLPAEDAPAFMVNVSDGVVRAGDTFTVTLNTKNNPGVVSLLLKVGYDADVLELVSVEEQDFAGASFGPLTANPIAVNWFDALNPNNTTDGVVATLTFKVKETAELGDAMITLEFNPNDVYDFDFENVDFAIVDGVVSVVDYIIGDVNGDTLINNKDLGLLQRYINGWDVAANASASDVNGDGLINNKDLGVLQRYINGWDVELK